MWWLSEQAGSSLPVEIDLRSPNDSLLSFSITYIFTYIYIYIYICMCVCVCVCVCEKWIESDRVYEEKGKNRRKIYVWRFLHCVDVFWHKGFVWIQKYLIKIIFVWEINLTDNFFSDSVGNLYQGFEIKYWNESDLSVI